MSLRRIARNKHGDVLWELLGGVSRCVVSPHWEVFANQEQYVRLVNGDKEQGKLTTYSLLKPSLFEGFSDTILAGACFTDSMLYLLWTADGTEFEPVHDRLYRHLRYTQHQNGHLITISYALEDDWSKNLRNKRIEGEADATVFSKVVAAIDSAFGDEPFLWMANNDVQASPFSSGKAERLPNSPHGLNSYQSFHCVAVLSALNPPPAHFTYLASKGVDGYRVRTALYRSAVYQAVVRCSARNPNDQSPKHFVVMDRSTAEWLATLFPGATVKPLPGMGLVPRKGTPGRNRIHATDADRQRACRQDKKLALFADLDRLNDTAITTGHYPGMAIPCHKNPIRYGDSVTGTRTSGSVYGSIYDATPLGHLDHEGDDAYVEFLRSLHGRVLAKDEAGLISPATFDPDMVADTKRGLDNITHLRGIWLDNDGGDLTHQEFVSFFPFLRIVVWNTPSHTPERPRWRAFIPTTHAMSIEVHSVIMRQIEATLNTKGYWSTKQLADNLRIKSRKTHGFDASKFNAASLFYLPVQAANPAHSFFLDHNDRRRGALDVPMWIENCIVELADIGNEVEVEDRPAPAAAVVAATSISNRLRTIQEALAADKASSGVAVREKAIEAAVSAWRSTPSGDGHAAFFKLAVALQRAGLDEAEIKAKLHEESAYAHSRAERRAEIPGILKSLKKRGRIG